MLKKVLPVLIAPLLLAGCAATFTNLTPKQQARNANNLYPVEVSLASRQQTLRWDTIHASIVVGSQSFPMRSTLLLHNRWEGLVPVPPGTKLVHYRYRFDYQSNAFGNSKADSAVSPDYTLKISDQ
jgi:hypothetical protein